MTSFCSEQRWNLLGSLWFVWQLTTSSHVLGDKGWYPPTAGPPGGGSSRNLPRNSAPPWTTPDPAWAETPSLSAVGEVSCQEHPLAATVGVSSGPRSKWCDTGCRWQSTAQPLTCLTECVSALIASHKPQTQIFAENLQILTPNHLP